MSYSHFSHNGQLRPIDEATIPLSSVEYSYGFGVYETLRVREARPLFVQEHLARLIQSARIIGIEHSFEAGQIANYLASLIDQNHVQSCNIKILLVGGTTTDTANLYILCLNPLFPDRKLYKTGVSCITQQYERPFPHAKSLNMLPSYLAYRAAKQAGAYDALLLNTHDQLVEGTRTNLLALKDQTLITPPSAQILLGVMRDQVLRLAQKNGYTIQERPIGLNEAISGSFDDLFLTSTSSKIMPIRTIDNHDLGEPSSHVHALMRQFDSYLKEHQSTN